MDRLPGWVKRSMAPLGRGRQTAEVLFWLSPRATPLWCLDYRYGALFVRLDTERLATWGRVSLNAEFEPSWPLDVTLGLVCDERPKDRAAFARTLAARHDALAALLGSDAGRARLEPLRPEEDEARAADMARVRTPQRAAELTAMGLERTRDTYWFGVIEPVAGTLALGALGVLAMIVIGVLTVGPGLQRH